MMLKKIFYILRIGFFEITLNRNIWIYAIVALLAIILVIIKNRIIYSKLEHKPLNINLYQRDLPSNLKPAHVRMLLHDGLVDEKSLAATILDLIDKGFLDIKRENKELENKIDLFRNREIIISKTNKDTSKLLRYEKFLIDWFIEKYGNGRVVTSGQIMEKLHKNIYKEQPYNLFECWQGLVFLSFPLKKFYKIKSITNLRIIYLLFTILGFITIIPLLSEFLGIYGLGCLMFASPLCVLNDDGIEEKDKWLDLKRYLKDFSNIEENTIEMVKIWQFYLTYSISLDIESISSEELENFFGDNIYNYFEKTRRKQ